MKYPKYQDYVIKDGKFIGEFEQMYQDYDNPWDQLEREKWSSSKIIVLNYLERLKPKKVIELGCGLGHYTKRIFDLGIDVLGVDISSTAVKKASDTYPECKFLTGDILDFYIYEVNNPDIIVMADVTWYVLDKLDSFLLYLKNKFPEIILIHLLSTYDNGVQKYGVDKFTNLKEILKYFNMKYEEYGEFGTSYGGGKRTYFIGKFK